MFSYFNETELPRLSVSLCRSSGAISGPCELLDCRAFLVSKPATLSMCSLSFFHIFSQSFQWDKLLALLWCWKCVRWERKGKAGKSQFETLTEGSAYHKDGTFHLVLSAQLKKGRWFASHQAQENDKKLFFINSVYWDSVTSKTKSSTFIVQTSFASLFVTVPWDGNKCVPVSQVEWEEIHGHNLHDAVICSEKSALKLGAHRTGESKAKTSHY